MKPKSRYHGLTLFVTVGSTRFDKLINEILSENSVEHMTSLGFNRLVLQVGKSEYDPKHVASLMDKYNINIEAYDYKSSIHDDIQAADVVVGHAGAGTCLEVLRLNRRLVIVANDELMDNHQNELAEQLAKENFVVHTTVDQVGTSLKSIYDNEAKLCKFPVKDPSKFEEIFNDALKKATSRL